MSNHYPNRRFVIFNISELSTIDFSQVYETSADTVRKSVDELKTFVKFDLPMPSSVTALNTKSQEYNYDEMLVILDTSEWMDSPPPA
jgi:hypothetical protein